MSLIGSALSFNFSKCSCIFGGSRRISHEKSFYQTRLLALQNTTDIRILPFQSYLRLTDIFPVNNHVEQWSTYVMGKNKRLVVAQDNLALSDASMLNKRYDNVLEGKNGEFFDLIFDMIVNGHEGQFLMVYKEQLYFANTYTFKNADGLPIGGILFVRLYSSLSELQPDSQILSMDIRKSNDYVHAVQEIRKITKNEKFGEPQSNQTNLPESA